MKPSLVKQCRTIVNSIVNSNNYPRTPCAASRSHVKLNQHHHRRLLHQETLDSGTPSITFDVRSSQDVTLPVSISSLALHINNAAYAIPKSRNSAHLSFTHPPATTLDYHNARDVIDGPGTSRRRFYGSSCGDDAYLTHPQFLGVADGVGQWNTKERGAPALWSRLILHHFARQCRAYFFNTRRGDVDEEGDGLDVRWLLQCAYKDTVRECHARGDWLGSTTACVGLIDRGNRLRVATIGDSRILVVRHLSEVVCATTEQQHWFDCPFQVGTNSLDQPVKDSETYTVDLQPGDVIVASTDGLSDNLFDAEIIAEIQQCLADEAAGGGLDKLAQRLCVRAHEVGQDPWGESPWMEKAIIEGLPFHGGKSDDVSVVVGRVVLG